jgi:hypothetical protein
MPRNKAKVNTTALSKKYKCDVNRIIRLWKNEKSDFEISQSLSIDTIKLQQIRQEIAHLYEKERQKRFKDTHPTGLAFTDKRF